MQGMRKDPKGFGCFRMPCALAGAGVDDMERGNTDSHASLRTGSE